MSGKRTAFIIAAAVVLFVSSTAGAQSYRVVDLNPNWSVGITNDLVFVGYAFPLTPIVADSNGIRFSGQNISTLRVTPTGYISGIRQRDVLSFVAFRVRVDGSDYREVFVGGISPVMAVDAISDNGVVIVGNDWSPMRQVSPYDQFNEFQVWDGIQLLPVTAVYGLTSTAGAHITSIADDGTIGGRLGDEPFLVPRGGPGFRPWSGRGSVSGIGAGGHVVGTADGQVVVRKPDGSTQLFPEMQFAARPNRFGDFAGSSRDPVPHAVAVVGGRLVDLDAFFFSPGEYLAFASTITDDGVILANVARSATGDRTRQVLLVPNAAPPSGLQFTVVGGLVSLTWQSSPNAREYFVEAGTAPGLSNVFNGSVGAQTSISGVVPRGRYYARVRARDVGGISGPSEEVVIDVP